MKFIHAADIHIDSPLKGLCFEENDAANRLRLATREAFAKLIDLAITEQVDFIIIAGDLFDGQWPDMRTGLWTAEQFRRLREHNIRVYLIRGNHDAESVVKRHISFPEEVVFEFSANKSHSLVDPRSGAVLHGQSFANRKVLEDLADKYPDATSGAFNIGILHTSLAGNPEHDTYAPTSPDVLARRGYQYWALGHIHQRQVLQGESLIVFPGNTQGRHIKESGAKGCYVVTVEDDGVIHTDFRVTDVVRWQMLDVPLANGDDEGDLFDQLPAIFDSALQQCEGRPLVTRLRITGACKAHAQLVGDQSRIRVLNEVRNRASDCGAELWIERIVCSTSPPVDIDELRQGDDILGQLLRSFDLARNDDAHLAELATYFQPLLAKVGDAIDEEQINFNDPQQIRRWLDQAEGLLLAELLRGDA